MDKIQIQNQRNKANTRGEMKIRKNLKKLIIQGIKGIREIKGLRVEIMIGRKLNQTCLKVNIKEEQLKNL